MKTSEFNYDLPEELIAQHPLPERAGSRMMVVHRETGEIEHKDFADIVDYLSPDDLLVLNNTRVFPARLYGIKSEGEALIEVLLTKEIKENLWEVLMKPAKRLKIGDRINFSENLIGTVEGWNDRGRRYVLFEPHGGSLLEIIEEIGKVPLPPYIKRQPDQYTDDDKLRYQTVFAKKQGSVAAPTAGLHFDSEILKNINDKNIKTVEITLHVGPGTFTPVNTENVEDFKMEREMYEISRTAARRIEAQLIQEKPIVAVGTTVTRALESNYIHDTKKRFKHGKRETEIFIFPGFKFNVVSRMLTNFHLPNSTLILMVSAFAGRELIQKAYREAISQRYRFYSYGDCMLII